MPETGITVRRRAPRGSLARLSTLVLVSLALVALAPTVVSAAQARRCGDLFFTPNSGDGLFDIKTRGIGCRAARERLREWRTDGYQPRTGPEGFRCRTIRRFNAGNGRERCARHLSGRTQAIYFTSGT